MIVKRKKKKEETQIRDLKTFLTVVVAAGENLSILLVVPFSGASFFLAFRQNNPRSEFIANTRDSN